MEQEKAKTLEFIQGIINRMASNSFAIKGFTVTMITAVIALNKIYYSYICIVAVLWLLDSFYLSLERSYENLYNYTRLGLSQDSFNITLRNSIVIKLKEEISNKNLDERIRNTSILSCLISYTESCFYIPFAVLLYYYI